MEHARSRLMIVAPYRDEDVFLATLGRRLRADISLLNYDTGRALGKSRWRRHAYIFTMALRAFNASRTQDIVLFGEQFVGLYYALFCRVLFWRSHAPQAAVLQLIYNRKQGWAGRCYRAVYRWLIASPALRWLICHASLERTYYHAEFGTRIAGKIYYVPFGRNAPSRVSTSNASFDYFFSGGTSNRDYATLINAFRGLDARLVIACHTRDVAGLNLPANVTAVHDAFGEVFSKLVEGARAVVLPIRSTDVSAGQLVLLDAMRAGRACIVTSGSCMDDYVDDDCAIRVPPGDAQALATAVLFLATNHGACEQLGCAASARYAREFTREAFADRICDLLRTPFSATVQG